VLDPGHKIFGTTERVAGTGHGEGMNMFEVDSLSNLHAVFFYAFGGVGSVSSHGKREFVHVALTVLTALTAQMAGDAGSSVEDAGRLHGGLGTIFII